MTVFDFGIWCNGNTTDSGPVILGSSPSIPTTTKCFLIVESTFFYLTKGHMLTGQS